MKHKISVRLAVYFALALLVFAVAIGFTFTALFAQHTLDMTKRDMESRATLIAEKLSPYLAEQAQDQGGQEQRGSQGGTGYGAFLRNLDAIAMTDVWIVDKNLDLITTGVAQAKNYTYQDLPANAEEVVAEVFAGKTTFSESFSNLFEAQTLTVGTPIFGDAGEVVGVVLLHSPAIGMDDAVAQGIFILVISIAVALAVSVLLSTRLSLTFTRPLTALKNTTLDLADGDYSVRTDIRSKDEIGTLASSVDVLAERLKEAERQSEKFEKMRNDFVANVSHELRTPLTVIRGSLEALLDGVVTEKEREREYLGQMLGETKLLQRLVGDLLDLSKLQNMDFKIEKQPIPLCNILTDVKRGAERVATQKKIKIGLEIASENCVMLGDWDRIRQMFMVVADNAVKFSPEGGEVSVLLWEDEKLYVSVKDNGRGISQKELPDIFDKFAKTDDPANRGGTGLGLAIAKQIAVRHDILINVKSEEGKGTEFIFEIPKYDPDKK